LTGRVVRKRGNNPETRLWKVGTPSSPNRLS
jgi:hypothetical protein